jgi:hypothetical protein
MKKEKKRKKLENILHTRVSISNHELVKTSSDDDQGGGGENFTIILKKLQNQI